MISETIITTDSDGNEHTIDVLVSIDMAKAWVDAGGVTITDRDIRYLVDNEHVAERLPDGRFRCTTLGILTPT